MKRSENQDIYHYVAWKPTSRKSCSHDLNLVVYTMRYSVRGLDVYGYFYDYQAARDMSAGYQFFKLAFSEDFESYACYYGCTGDIPPTECWCSRAGETESGLDVSDLDRDVYSQVNDYLNGLHVIIKDHGETGKVLVTDLIARCEKGNELESSLESDAGNPFAGVVRDVSSGVDPFLVMLIGLKFDRLYKISRRCSQQDFRDESAILVQIRCGVVVQEAYRTVVTPLR